MSIACRLYEYIAGRKLVWDPVSHQTSSSSLEAAHLAHVPPDRLAKAVVLRKSQGGCLMAVIPANHRLDVDDLGEALGDDLSLVGEHTLNELFVDCRPGAVPPLGTVYGVSTFWDERLATKPDVYFEGGDHQTLVHMTGTEFDALMRRAATRLPPSCH
jgi:Ala-tRNA(Pro) deacylase